MRKSYDTQVATNAPNNDASARAVTLPSLLLFGTRGAAIIASAVLNCAERLRQAREDVSSQRCCFQYAGSEHSFCRTELRRAFQSRLAGTTAQPELAPVGSSSPLPNGGLFRAERLVLGGVEPDTSPGGPAVQHHLMQQSQQHADDSCTTAAQPSLDWSELEVFEKIASGTDTDIFRASLHGDAVAVKVLSKYASTDAEDAFNREWRTFVEHDLRHQNIIRFYGWGYRPNGERFLVVEHAKGGSLRQALTRRLWKDIGRVVRLARDITAALEYLHSRNIIYRDLKSSNVLLDASWNRALLCDFGIARAMIGDGAGQMTRECGTYQYMSPEVILGKADYGEKADIYSFGILLNEMCTGEIPFSRQRLLPVQAAAAVVNKGLRPGMRGSVERKYPELHALIRKCWAQRDDARPTAAEARAELDAILVKYFSADQTPTADAQLSTATT
jgi:serine/threonine protein kinase